MKATISLEPGTTAYGKPRKRLLAWLLESNAHGLGYKLHYMEEGDEPEINEWIRAPWLDEPEARAELRGTDHVTVTVDLPASCIHGLDSYDRQTVMEAVSKAVRNKEVFKKEEKK